MAAAAQNGDAAPAGPSFPNILDYLAQQSVDLVDRLYASPASCLGVFGFLSPLSKHLILQHIYGGPEIPAALFQSAARSDEKCRDALKELQKHHICRMQQGTVIFNQNFQTNLRIALAGGARSWFTGEVKDDKYTPDLEQLNSHAETCWESMLNYLVGTTTDTETVVKNVLPESGLMQPGANNVMEISALGFQFLLQDQRTQVWFYVISFLRLCEREQVDVAEALSFFFKMSFCVLGQDYPSEQLTPTERVVLRHCCKAGFAYQRKKRSSRFYPTRLALLLTQPSVATEEKNKNFLIVETNFHVYAYTTSELKIALLRLFADVRYRLPSMTSAIITRASIRRALKRGISSLQVLRFMQTHCHAHMEADPMALFSPVPQTVSDQIALWEVETNRLKTTPGILISGFTDEALFNAVVQHASSLGCLHWFSPEKASLIVSDAAKAQIKTFIRQHRDTDSSIA